MQRRGIFLYKVDREGMVVNMLGNVLKKLLIISVVAVLLYGCYSLLMQTGMGSSAQYAQTAVKSPIIHVQTGIEYLNSYFPKKAIVVKRKMYRDGELIWESEYDKAGNEIKQVGYNSDGSIDSWTEYEYNTDGKGTMIVWYNDDGSVNARSEFKYDNEGNLIEDTQYNQGGHNYKEIRDYDEAGNEIECVRYVNKDLYRRYEYEYDEAGKKKTTIVYDSDGDIRSFESHEYEYDEGGNITKDVSYYDGGEMVKYCTTQYRYDEAGKIKEKITCNGDDIIYRHEYEYDEEGRLLIETVYDDDGSNINRRYEHEYDKNGNKIKYTCIENGEIISQSEYCYDEWGNVIEERSGEGGAVYTYEYEFIYAPLDKY